MVTPLERAVEALKDKIGGEPWHDGQWLIDGPFPQSDLVEAVRAVLTAIREPDAAAVEAAQDYIDGSKWDEAKPEALMAWEIIIDALLAEGSTD